MKEWLKEFRQAHYVWYYQDDNRSEDQFISDYLRDHPLPLPTDEDIERVVNTYVYTRDRNLFRKGARWMRDQIRKEEK